MIEIRCPLIPNGCEESSSAVTVIVPPHPPVHPLVPEGPGVGVGEDLAETPSKYRDKLLWVRFGNLRTERASFREEDGDAAAVAGSDDPDEEGGWALLLVGGGEP